MQAPGASQVWIRFVAYAKYWRTAMAGAHLLVLSPSPTACPLRGYGRAGTQNGRLSEAVILSTGTSIPAQRPRRRRCRCRADIACRRPVWIRFVAYAKYWLTAMAGAHLLVLASGRFRSGRADRDGRGEAAAAPESGANGPASLPPPAVLETRSACSANKKSFFEF